MEMLRAGHCSLPQSIPSFNQISVMCLFCERLYAGNISISVNKRENTTHKSLIHVYSAVWEKIKNKYHE